MIRLVRACSLALLAIGLLSPSMAKAAHCGRYALSEARFERDLASLFAGESSADSGLFPNSPIPPAPPCRGAFCSAPPVAPAAPVAPVASPGEHGLCQVALVEIPPADSYLVEPDRANLRPIGRGLSIFHPPRHLAPSA
jgi:hypothetical protein